MSDLFEKLRASVRTLEEAIAESDDRGRAPRERVLEARTARIARQPERIDRAPDTTTCMLFERSGRRYAAPLSGLREVGPLGPVAHVPGIPDAYLGVAARRGRIVSVVDLPQLFGATASRSHGAAAPPWLILAASTTVVCGVAADDLRDVIDVQPGRLARAMPTFPALLQRHTLGVLEDGTVVIDLVGLLEDRHLRVEERGA